jgi:exosortase B
MGAIAPRGWVGSWPAWQYVIAILSAALLYVPVYVSLAANVWSSSDDLHGPIILIIAVWLGVRHFREYSRTTDSAVGRSTGWWLLLLGLLVYIVGQSQAIYVFGVGSQLLVLPGAILAIRGWPSLRVVWFPLAFLAFLIPLPDIIVSGLTAPLKQMVSVIAENLLYAAGYPIARTGVILSVGPYELLVADACSGLNSIFTLVALAALYLHLMQYRNLLYNALILVCAIPIAIAANVVRVVVLVLVTYHFGDAAGQGFIHSFAGMLLFAVALSLFLGLDGVLLPIAKRAGLNVRQP